VTTVHKLIEHEIYAENLLLGKILFFTLNLPDNWQLSSGVSRPEIHATHERRDRKWVVAGDAWYVVHDDDRRWAMEMAISIRSGFKKLSKNSSETIPIATHPAQVRWKEKRRGLPWQRHTVTFMIVEFNCPYSERQLKLEFSGWCSETGFREILQSLTYLRCH